MGASSAGGFQDATVFHYAPYAHSGNGVALLGSATGADNLTGTLSPTRPLNTLAHKQYTITFFHSSSFSPADEQVDTIAQVLWNGNVVGTIRPGFSLWTYYHFEVVAVGNDTLAFRGGQAPAWSFIDDVYVFEA